MGHAYEQGPIHKEPDQPAMIARSLDILEKFTGKRPVGWLGPGLTQTYETPDLLADAGIKYIGDWVYDDEPTVIRTANGPLVTLPYTVELNDIPMMIVQHHESDYLLKRAIDQFDRLYAEGAQRAKIMALAIHPYISGQPFRIKYLEQIYDHVGSMTACCTGTASRSDWYLRRPAPQQMRPRNERRPQAPARRHAADRAHRLFADHRRARRSSCPAAPAWWCGASSTSRNGTSSRRCRAPC